MQDLVIQTTVEVPVQKLVLDQKEGSSLLLLEDGKFKASGQPPTALNVTNIPNEGNIVELAWTEPAFGTWDTYTVYAYNTQTQKIEQQIEEIHLPEATVFGLANTIEYEFWVVSVKDGLESYGSNHVLATPLDVIAPASPTGVAIVSAQNEQLDLTWDANSEDDLAGYNVYLDSGSGFVKHNSNLVTGVTYSIESLVNGQNYTVHVTAVDESGNESTASNQINVTITDTIAPEAPTGLQTTAFTDTTIDIEWDESPEEDVAGYNVYVDGAIEASSVATPSYSIAGLLEATSYDIYVTAVDTAGNESNTSITISQTTQDLIPSAPTGLVASPAATEMGLSWDVSAETDLAGYNIYVDGVKDNTSLITPEAYTVTGLTETTSYEFKITAVDTAGNESTFSTPVTESTADVQPDAPTNFAVTVEEDYALSFDGDDYVDTNLLWINGVQTIEMQAKPVDFIREDLFGIRDNVGTDQRFYLWFDNRLGGGSSEGIQFSLGSSPVALEYITNEIRWYHIAITYNPSTNEAELFVDGISRDIATVASDPIGISYLIGAINDGAGNPINADGWSFKGQVDNVRIWNTIRTQQEIDSNKDVSLTGSETSLVAYYKMNEGSGTTAIDSAGTNDGTIFGATYEAISKNAVGTWDAVTGVDGYNAYLRSYYNNVSALNFSGSSSRVEIPDHNSLDLNNALTIEAWIKPTSLAGGFETIINKGQTSTSNTASAGATYSITILNGDLRLSLLTEQTFSILSTGWTPVLNEWNHIAFTWDNSVTGINGYFYLNGVLFTSQEMFNLSLANTTHRVCIGWDYYRSTDSRMYFKGDMDEVRVWDIARTVQEIESNYLKPLAGAENGLVGYWKFDEQSGSLIVDETGVNDGSSTGVSYVDTFNFLPSDFEKQNTQLIPTSPVEHALSFDGVDDYVEIADNSLFRAKAGFTIESIMRRGSLSDTTTMFWKRDTNGGWRLTCRADGVIILTFFNVADYPFSADHAIIDQDFHRVSVVITDDLKGRLFIDGVFKQELALSPPTTSTAPLYFSAATDGTNIVAYTEGTLYEQRIWGVARTDAQILEDHNTELEGNEAGLVGYWKLDEGSGTTAIDSAGSNDGTINGGAEYLRISGPEYTIVDILDGDNEAYVTAVKDGVESDPSNVKLFSPTGYKILIQDSLDRVIIPQDFLPSPCNDIHITTKASTHVDKATTFLHNEVSGTNRINIHFPWSNGYIYWDFGDISNGGRINTFFDPSWYGIMATWEFISNSNGMKILRNGVVLESVNTSNSITPTNDLLYINPSESYNWIGEVESLIIKSSGIEILRYDIDEGQGTILKDTSGSLNDATLENTEWSVV